MQAIQQIYSGSSLLTLLMYFQVPAQGVSCGKDVKISLHSSMRCLKEIDATKLPWSLVTPW